MDKKNIKIFITFGGGDIEYYNAGKRLIKQAQNTGFFDNMFYTLIKILKNDIIWLM